MTASCAEAQAMLGSLDPAVISRMGMDVCLPDGPRSDLLPLIARRCPRVPSLVFGTSFASSDRNGL